LDLFLQGIAEYSLPSRVRSGHGLENIDVTRYMLEREDWIGEALLQVALSTTAWVREHIKMFKLLSCVTLPRFSTEWNEMAFWTR
jgi:aminoglycoside phosphotransferase family enzyme